MLVRRGCAAPHQQRNAGPAHPQTLNTFGIIEFDDRPYQFQPEKHMATKEEIIHQQTLLTAYRRNLAHYLTQQAVLGEAYVPPIIIQGIRDARENIRRVKSILRGWNVPVVDHPDDRDDVPPSLDEQQTPQKVDRVRLRRILAEYFNDDELRDLSFDMSIDYESLPGVGKASKARELIAFVERYGRFQDLVEHTRSLRPNIIW
jgi:hypothetical protein